MIRFLNTNRAGRPPRRRMTAVSFSPEDLAELGQIVAAGQVALQRTAPVVARLKAAMTRMGVTHP